MSNPTTGAPERTAAAGERRVILIRYGEIGLKRKNRRFFEDILAARARRALGDRLGVRVRRVHGRLIVEGVDDDLAGALDALRRVFGIVALHPAFQVEPTLPAAGRAALAVLDDERARLGASPLTFKVAARRSDKAFPLNSMEINRELGTLLLEARGAAGLAVDVHRPHITVHVEVRRDGIYVYGNGIAGPGGLPVGVSGRVLTLLSGGIDSPVAAWMAMKRGAEVEAVHFHSYPFTSDRSLEKVVDLTRVLDRWGGPVLLHVVHFTEIQKAIRADIPAELGITVMRRMMFRIAEALARRRGALALVTGESVGQVASQTLESIATISVVTTMPVLRPLVGLDKTEIIQRARDIGTYELSILPYEDCCSLFVPRHPSTRPQPGRTARAEAVLDVDGLVERALAGIETRTAVEDDAG